jgi:hypothetical protein
MYMHVQEVEEWIAARVKETVLAFIKSNALEKAAKKKIHDKVAKIELGDKPA